MKPYITRRPILGFYDTLVKELAEEDPGLYKNFLRIDEDLFNEIVTCVGPHIEKQTTFCRSPIEPGLRIAITLRFLATGDSYRSLSYAFRVAVCTIHHIVPETCEAIAAVYGEEVMQFPKCPAQWKEVAAAFSITISG